jgi:hypothetical protein
MLSENGRTRGSQYPADSALLGLSDGASPHSLTKSKLMKGVGALGASGVLSKGVAGHRTKRWE